MKNLRFSASPLLRLTLISSLVASLGGCTAIMVPDKVSNDTKIADVSAKNPLYADLQLIKDDSQNEHWQFVNISKESSRNPESPRVNIAQMKPNEEPAIRAARGFFGIFPTTTGAVIDAETVPDAEVATDIDNLNSFSASPFSLVLTPVAGTIMLPGSALFGITGHFKLFSASFFPLFGKYGPSQSKYVSAINQAKKADNLEKRLPNLINRYDAIVALSTEAPQPIAERRRIVDDSRIKATSSWQNAMQQLAVNKVPIRINNLSGWPLDAHDLRAELSATITPPDWTLIAPEQSLMQYRQKILYPAKTINQFESRLADMENGIAGEIADATLGLQNYENASAQFTQDLGNLNADAVINTQAVKKSLSDWRIAGDIDNFIVQLRQGELSGTPCLCITVQEKNFTDVIPRSFSMNDKAISVQWSYGRLRITNNTNNYVTIDAVTIYQDGAAKTEGGENFQNYSEIAPGSSTTLTNRSVQPTGNTYTLTYAEAAHTTMRLGFAVKYRMTQDATPRSLYNVKDYSVLSMVQ